MGKHQGIFTNWKTAGLMVLLLLAFAACYWKTVAGLLQIWSTNDDYSYAFLIPIISAYLIWERRRQIAATPVGTSWVGGMFFLLFLIISVYGILGSSPSAVRPAVPLMILSITLFCFGKDMLRVLAFPLSLLIFMIPLPTMFGTLIGSRLRLVSTQLGKIILRLSGVSVFVEGNIIDLGAIQLQVADACSGLRYILPLLALGVVFAHYFEKTRWKQILLVLATIPIAVLTNGIRIGITGALAERYGTQVAEGFYHGFSGWLVFIFAFSLLLVFYFTLKVLFSTRPVGKALKTPQEAESAALESKYNRIPIVICSTLLLLAGILSYTTAALPARKIDGTLASFPITIKGWKGALQHIDPEMVDKSGAQEALSAIYNDGSGKAISLYMGYRESPFNESENFFHSPYVCLPSSGWKTLMIRNHKITNIPHFGFITVREMISERIGQKQLVYYWFQTKSRTSYDVNINRLHLAWHAIRRDNTYDLFIRPITPLQHDEKIEDAEERMDQFVRDMMDVLLKFLADNQVEGSV